MSPHCHCSSHNSAYEIEALCPLCGTLPVVPATREAEAGGLPEGRNWRFSWSLTVRSYLEWGWGNGAVEKVCAVNFGGLKSDSLNTKAACDSTSL